MKNLNLPFCNAWLVRSEIKLFIAAVVLITTAASCNKQTEQPVNNIAAYRSDATEAQALYNDDISSNTVLKDRVDGVDYIVKNDINVTAGILTIKQGVTLMFENGTGITVSEGGSLTAIGEQGNEVYFIGRNNKRGDWKGITILNNNIHNVLSHIFVAHAGSTANTTGQANVVVGNNAAVEISESEITASAASGIVIGKDAEVRGFTDNKIHTNTTFPVTVDITGATKLRDGNTYTNNGREFIALAGYETRRSGPITLRDLKEPYMLTGSITTTNSIVINAGTRMYMANGAQITISGNGWFSALGNAANPVIITGEYSNSGLWNAINFVSTASTNNRLEYCQITGGGGAAQSMHGMVNLMGSNGGNTLISIRNCWVKNSASTGIYIQKQKVQYNNDIETSNQFASNTLANVYYDIN